MSRRFHCNVQGIPCIKSEHVKMSRPFHCHVQDIPNMQDMLRIKSVHARV